jgi:hypothetical protein
VVDGDELEFGVSGLLYESNLLMYDRQTESLWSQSRGEAVVGERTGDDLEILPMQLIIFEELQEKYPDALVLSKDTGHVRDYENNPYRSYEGSDSLYFDVTGEDARFPNKEAMYVFEIGETSYAFPYSEVPESGATLELDGHTVEVSGEGGEVFVFVDGQRAPGYVEMWFSWVTQHQEDGEVVEFD